MEPTIRNLYPSLVPKAGTLEVGKKVFQLLDEILKDRNDKGLPDKWNRAYELRRAVHWKNKSVGVPLATINFLGAHHQRTVNMLTDNNPTFNVTPYGQVPDEILEVVTKAAENWWENTDQQHVFEESVSTGETYGTVAETVRFDPDAEYPLGEVVAETIDLFNFGWYPVKQRKIQKCDAVFHFWPMPVHEAQRRYPKFAERIIADSEYIKKINDTRSEIIGGSMGGKRSYLSTIQSVVKRLMTNKTQVAEGEEETLVVECWVKDYSGAYFGNIRQIICGVCGEVVFSDENNPSINPDMGEAAADTYLFDKFPFSLTQSITDPSSPYGMNDYEQLESLNVEINKSVSQLTIAKDSAARGKFINPQGSGVPNEHINNVSGVISPTVSTAGMMRYVDPPRVDPSIMASIEIFTKYFYSLAGSFELDNADAPGSKVIAAKAIAALLENANRMMRGKARNYSKMIRDRGRMFLSMAQNWYTESRYIQIDDNGKKQSVPISSQILMVPAKLTVISGSTMPRSDIQKREESLELFKLGALPVDEFLKAMNWSDWKSVAKKVQAGPLGGFFEILQAVGVPPELIQYFQQAFEAKDAKEAAKDVEAGELPGFEQVMSGLTGQQQEDPLADMEISIKDAEREKIIMESELIREKINTEKVQQQVLRAGMVYDEEQIKIDRAKAAIEIELKRAMTDGDDTKPSAPKKGQGAFRDRGTKSDNKEVKKK